MPQILLLILSTAGLSEDILTESLKSLQHITEITRPVSRNLNTNKVCLDSLLDISCIITDSVLYLAYRYCLFLPTGKLMARNLAD